MRLSAMRRFITTYALSAQRQFRRTVSGHTITLPGLTAGLTTTSERSYVDVTPTKSATRPGLVADYMTQETAITPPSEHRAPVVVRDANDKRDDRERLEAACRALRKLGYAAFMSVKRMPLPSNRIRCIYWYAVVDKMVFRGRNLYETLWVTWYGDLDEVMAALAAEGLRAMRPEAETRAIAILPMPDAPHRFSPWPSAISSGDYHRPCWVCEHPYNVHYLRAHKSQAQRKRE